MGSLLSLICTLFYNAYKSSSHGKKLEIVFILGGPGSGKSTQSANIVKQFGYTHLSVGDLLRKEIESGSDNGAMIQSMMKDGKLLPSDMVVNLIQRAIEESGNSKILIDGFPRNEENRVAFEQIVKIEPKFVLFIDCSEDDMRKRLLSRNQGRADDNLGTIAKRLEVFKDYTLPVIDYYMSKGKFRKIDGSKSVEEAFLDVESVFTAARAN